MSLRLVAPTTQTVLCLVKPSHFDRNVCTISSAKLSVLRPPRRPKTPSHSSTKITALGAERALCHSSLTFPPLCPMYPALRSDIERGKNTQPMLSAKILAISVFPVPGGPNSNNPREAAVLPFAKCSASVNSFDLTASSMAIDRHASSGSSSTGIFLLDRKARVLSIFVATFWYRSQASSNCNARLFTSSCSGSSALSKWRSRTQEVIASLPSVRREIMAMPLFALSRTAIIKLPTSAPRTLNQLSVPNFVVLSVSGAIT